MDRQKERCNLKASKNEIIDVNRLVELVKERPAVWDRTVEGYRSRDVSIPIWEEIYRNICDGYDEYNAEDKKAIGKGIKDKWTNARDIWQRTYKKRKEAMEKGENVSDIKDNVRYEKLMFLAKVYDKEDYLPSEKEVNFLDPNVGKRPLSPQADFDVENVPNFNSSDFHRNFLNVIMDKKSQQKTGTPQKSGFNLASKKRKLENGKVSNAQLKNVQGSTHNPVIINVGESFKPNIPGSNNRNHGASPVDSKETNKNILRQTQSSKFEDRTSNAVKDKMPETTNNHLTRDDPDEIPRAKQEIWEIPPSPSEDENKPDVVDITSFKIEMEEVREEQISRKGLAQGDSSSNTEVDNFFHLLSHLIKDFDKKQMMDFFFESLRPLIQNFDKRQLLDFHIETLQLVKKMDGN